MDLLNIKPNQVSTNVNAYKILIYGMNKVGKTTLLSQTPECLVLATEKGTNAIAGIIAQPINKWSELREVLREFKNNEEVRNRYKCIGLDTIDYATGMCEKYICSQMGIEDLSRAPYGKAYKAVQDEFMSVINGFIDLGIGVIVVSHSEDVMIGEIPSKDGSDTIKIYRKEPTIGNKKIKKYILDAMDLVGYITSELKDDGTYDAKLHLRETKEYMAGNHFKYLQAEIPFNFEALQNAIVEAVKKEADNKGVETVDDINITKKVEKDFDELINEFNNIVNDLKTKEDFGTAWAPKIKEIVENHLGKGNKISNATRTQYEAVEAALNDLKDIAK